MYIHTYLYMYKCFCAYIHLYMYVLMHTYTKCTKISLENIKSLKNALGWNTKLS